MVYIGRDCSVQPSSQPPRSPARHFARANRPAYERLRATRKCARRRQFFSWVGHLLRPEHPRCFGRIPFIAAAYQILSICLRAYTWRGDKLPLTNMAGAYASTQLGLPGGGGRRRCSTPAAPRQAAVAEPRLPPTAALKIIRPHAGRAINSAAGIVPRARGGGAAHPQRLRRAQGTPEGGTFAAGPSSAPRIQRAPSRACVLLAASMRAGCGAR